jgi:Repeat of unknown function (DUF346)
VSIAAWGPDRLDVFGLGTDNAMYHKAWTAAGWQPDWEKLGGTFNSAPAVAAWGPDRRRLRARHRQRHVPQGLDRRGMAA